MNAGARFAAWWKSLTPEERAERRAQADAVHRRFRAARKRVLWGVLECPCHQGSVCGEACAKGYHHDGCENNFAAPRK